MFFELSIRLPFLPASSAVFRASLDVKTRPEAVGDLDEALRCYSAAASVHSTKPVVVTPRLKWRGRPISEVAAANAAAVSEQIAKGEGLEAATARLNLRG